MTPDNPIRTAGEMCEAAAHCVQTRIDEAKRDWDRVTIKGRSDIEDRLGVYNAILNSIGALASRIQPTTPPTLTTPTSPITTAGEALEACAKLADEYGLLEIEGLTFAGAMVVKNSFHKLAEAIRALPAQPPKPVDPVEMECHGLDTPERVCFYEQDFYVLSNFSAFSLMWRGYRFDTSEAAYHYEKFCGGSELAASVAESIACAPSAHEAFKLAEQYRAQRRSDWDDVKINIMREILCAKARQHEYVRRKLLTTGHRELVENSWRDDFWGWGPNRDGQNMLGKLWMEIRAELRGKP